MRAVGPVVVAALVLLAAACGKDEPRPGEAEWRAVWDEATAVVPESEAGLTRPVCDVLLRITRADREQLIPSPRATVDPLVEEWVGVAEALGLECEEYGDAGGQLGRLAELIGEVEAALDDRPDVTTG